MFAVGYCLAKGHGMNRVWISKFKCSIKSEEDGSRLHVTKVVFFISVSLNQSTNGFISSSQFGEVGVVILSLQMKKAEV